MIKVQVGQTVMVLSGHGVKEPVRGTVVKVGRVWIDVHKENRNWGWRFRLDTQTDGSGRGYAPRFYTLEQWAAHEREASVAAFLRAQGITIDLASPWRGRAPELAALLGWTPPDA